MVLIQLDKDYMLNPQEQKVWPKMNPFQETHSCEPINFTIAL